jgi:hypothetical protein
VGEIFKEAEKIVAGDDAAEFGGFAEGEEDAPAFAPLSELVNSSLKFQNCFR